MFETVPRRVTVYSVLDVIEGTLDLTPARRESPTGSSPGMTG